MSGGLRSNCHDDPGALVRRGQGQAGAGPLPEGVARMLITLLDDAGARYRVIDHPAEGATEAASALRGHLVRFAAKSIVLRVSVTRKDRRYVLAVVPGDCRVDLDEVGRLVGGGRVGFAARGEAERLTGSVSGSFPPVSFHPELRLIVDPSLLATEEIYFNAGRLDRSLALVTTDYVRVISPQVASIASPPHAGAAVAEPVTPRGG